MVTAKQVYNIILSCTVVADILLVGMQGDEGDGQRVTMTATMMGKTGGCWQQARPWTTRYIVDEADEIDDNHHRGITTALFINHCLILTSQ
jgi:hypothetical protein